MRYLIILLLLAGCASAPELRVERVPVPPTIEVPVLRNTTGDDRILALAEYIAALKAALQSALVALEVYRP